MWLSRSSWMLLTRSLWLAPAERLSSDPFPGSEEKLSWILIPVGCGDVKVPHIKVMDIRHTAPPLQGVPGTDAEVEGESVKVVDVRSD